MKRVCVVCEQEYEPDLERGGKFALIYCRPRCAWSTEPRSRESLIRERDALSKLLDDKPS